MFRKRRASFPSYRRDSVFGHQIRSYEGKGVLNRDVLTMVFYSLSLMLKAILRAMLDVGA